LGALCIFLPLILATRRGIMKGSFPYITYFFGIGIGFMMVEIAEMQRLIVFLGHPIYALTVVLFVFLLFSGIGSYFTDSLVGENLRRGGTIRLVVLIAVLLVTSIATPFLVSNFAGSVTPVRIALAVAMLAPMAFFMGMAFPIGMKAANIAHEGLAPWLWGINGAMSVVATVLAVAVSMTTTISHTFAIGMGAYLITLASFLYMAKRNFR
ncbi:MAG: hypothetical protein JJU11_05455, partial [Candidatus Sumerlaeia bacterium]|nr:hypothetical protein [Candidatus Sumerlaeia bacterium]